MAPLLGQKVGVDRAFERLYRRHAADVYRYAHAVLRNPADAEDVAQTTFMNAYRALERGETPETPHNWLIAIAHNVCRQRFRQASRRVREIGLDVDVAETLIRPEDDDAPTPEDINRALGHLAFNQRAALVLREIEGRSYAEIADMLELSVGAVETLIFRARRALREQLEGGLTCAQAEQALSRQLDTALTRAESSQLRAHLRECPACLRLARSQRAQRPAWKSLAAVPLPTSLASLFGGGGAAVATKAAAVVVAASVAGGFGYDVHRRLVPPVHHGGAAQAPKTMPKRGTQAAPPAARASKRSAVAVPIVAAVVRASHVRPAHAVATAATSRSGHTPRRHVAPAQRGGQAVEPAQAAEPAQTDAPAASAAVTHVSKRHVGRPAQPGQPTHGSGSPPAAAGRGTRGEGKPAKRDTPVKPAKPEMPPSAQKPGIVEEPQPAVEDLTQSSQKGGARNGEGWHLHP